ncbi:AAA family ATPase [Clostridium polynesiense]|uniref:AAA family ATPase n=1 Tax=Clostridium polynesiense TaxID=1325933 RepID=UPI000591814C|nr:MoxR family ATPase [Clostridium polynesiense]
MDKEKQILKNIINNISKVIIGKEDVITDIMKGIIAGGHILLEDVPGVGKTTLVKALAKSLSLSYSRIQFTPDLLPSDITGISIYNQKEMEFQFKKGPIFSNIVLADEINRTSPKTQSALLEVMEEKQVSEGNYTYTLEKPFVVLATQNPIDYEGTFILPEAQLDRFIMKVKIGYPQREEEINILDVYREMEPLQNIDSVASGDDIINLQKKVKEVKANSAVNEYIVDIANMTRNSSYISLGVSPRAALTLLRISQANALIKGRNYVIPEDVKENISLVLSHRIILSSLGKANGYTEEGILQDLIKRVSVPKVV